MKSIPALLLFVGLVLLAESSLAQEDVYIVTSKINGRLPKIGPVKHTSIAICPRGVSPIVCENGVPVSNCAQCQLYGTQLLERGFKLDEKRVGVSAQKLVGISSETIKRRMAQHDRLNIPFLNDCRHHVMQVTGRNKKKGPLSRLLAPLR